MRLQQNSTRQLVCSHAGGVVLQHSFQQLICQLVLAGLHVDVRQQQPATFQVLSVLECPYVLADALQVIPSARCLLQQDVSGGHAKSGSHVIPKSVLARQRGALLQSLLDVGFLLGGQQEEVAQQFVSQLLVRASLGIQFLRQDISSVRIT